FVYAVKTSGVYCRPSCPSRLAKPRNVRFFDTPAEAEAAGFRACLRCNPRGRSPAEVNAALVAEACRIIERSEEAPSLDALAARAGLSRHYFHRLFKTVTGLTPRAYAAAHRAGRVRAELAGASSVTDAIHAAGFNASSRFYERSPDMLGMKPSAYRDGGKDADIRFAVAQCALGAILVAQSDRGICAISLGDDPDALVRELQDRFPQARMTGDDPGFSRLVAKVV